MGRLLMADTNVQTFVIAHLAFFIPPCSSSPVGSK